MQILIEDIHHFQKEHFLPLQGCLDPLAEGQDTKTLLISCACVGVNLLMDRKPSGSPLLRNAGNLIPPHGSASGEAATIEFALGALGVNHIVICGHSGCQAMQGLLEPATVAGLPAVASWLGNAERTRRVVRDNYGHLEGAALLTVAAQENVLMQLENLRTLPAVCSRLVRGDLHLQGWVYETETDALFAYDAAERQFLPRPSSTKIN